MVRRLAVPGLALLLASLVPASAASPPGTIVLAPHRVVYDLTLAGASGSRAVEGARGRIVYDFTGNACEGYALKYRQVTVLESSESGTRTSDLRTTTFEGGDGRSFRFRTENSLVGADDKLVQGEAARGGEGLTVSLRQPEPVRVTLPGDPIFPTDHLKRIIAAAKADQRTLSLPVYDGSDTGRKVYDTLAIIGQAVAPGGGAALEEAARSPLVSGQTRWPVTLSYFAPGQGERTPIYVITFDLYENGVSRELRLDYGEFVLLGRMTSLESLPSQPCSR